MNMQTFYHFINLVNKTSASIVSFGTKQKANVTASRQRIYFGEQEGNEQHDDTKEKENTKYRDVA